MGSLLSGRYQCLPSHYVIRLCPIVKDEVHGASSVFAHLNRVPELTKTTSLVRKRKKSTWQTWWTQVPWDWGEQNKRSFILSQTRGDSQRQLNQTQTGGGISVWIFVPAPFPLPSRLLMEQWNKANSSAKSLSWQTKSYKGQQFL